MNTIKKTISVADLKAGDTVEIDGRMETVSAHHLRIGFTGATYKGDPHHRGIIRVNFRVPTAKGFRIE